MYICTPLINPFLSIHTLSPIPTHPPTSPTSPTHPQPALAEGEGPIGLVMAPARELAFQIFNETKKFTKHLGLRVACVYGGAGVADQIADLKRGAEIVVCTPGRMIDILCMQAGRMVTLRRVTMVVLDEADRCFDMGFAPQIEMFLQVGGVWGSTMGG